MEISKIQLAAALVAALGITAPALADESTSTDKTVKNSKVQLDDAAPKKEKKSKKGEKSCKKGEKSCKAAGGDAAAGGDKK